MKKLILLSITLMLLVFCATTNATVLWTETFESYSDWGCGTTTGTEQSCACPSGSSYSSCTAETKSWDGANPSSPLITISTAGGRSGKGFRIKQRIVCPTNYENIIKSSPIITSSNPLYIRWYQRDSWHDWRNSIYQKLFRLYPESGDQLMIPEFYGGRTSSSAMRLWFYNGAEIYWYTFDTRTFTDAIATPDLRNKWMCYELKIDVQNNVYEFWVNGVSMGSRSSSNPISSSLRVQRVAIGGNQANAYCESGPYYCWTPTTDVHTRDYDDLVASTSYIGPEGGAPSEFSIGGTLSGYVNGTLTLRNTVNGTDTEDLPLTANGSYEFVGLLNTDDTYAVTVLSNPMSQKCVVSNGSGTTGTSDITNVNVSCVVSKPSCVSGKISGGVSR